MGPSRNQSLSEASRQLSGLERIGYALNSTLGFWVPARMDEVSVAADGSMVEVATVYPNVRRFQVETTEVANPR